MSRMLPLSAIPVVVGVYQLPVGFQWDGRTYAIQEITNRWRVDREGWKPEPERIVRDYYVARTTNGLIAAFFYDRLTNKWYLQRLYD